MDQALMRDYRTLRERKPGEETASFLRGRLSLLGFRTQDGAKLESGRSGPALCFAAGLGEDGGASAAMVLTAAARAAERGIARGSLTVLLNEPVPAGSDAAALVLLPAEQARMGEAVLFSGGTAAWTAICRETASAVLGNAPRLERAGPGAPDGLLVIGLGADLREGAAPGEPEFRKAALERGADLLDALSRRLLGQRKTGSEF